MKKRFNFEDSDDPQDDNLFHDLDELNDSEYEQLIEHAEYVDLKNLNLAEYELNQKVLYKAIKLCEKNFFWSFKNPKSKIKLVVETYHILRKLTNVQEE